MKTNHYRKLCIFWLVLGLFSAAHGDETKPMPGSAKHAIVVPSQYEPWKPDVEGWIPTEADIQKAEEALVQLFQHPDYRLKGTANFGGKTPNKAPFALSEYYVRYSGLIKDGKKLIVGRAELKTNKGAEKILEEQAEVIVLKPCGGGPIYFELSYDPDSKRVISVEYSAAL